MMSDNADNEHLALLLRGLGYKPLNRAWAKAEILLGLSAAGGGLLIGSWAVRAASVEWLLAVGGLILFVLGGYLALAGSRSHLYQSSNELTSLLLHEIQRLHKKADSP